MISDMSDDTDLLDSSRLRFNARVCVRAQFQICNEIMHISTNSEILGLEICFVFFSVDFIYSIII